MEIKMLGYMAAKEMVVLERRKRKQKSKVCSDLVGTMGGTTVSATSGDPSGQRRIQGLPLSLCQERAHSQGCHQDTPDCVIVTAPKVPTTSLVRPSSFLPNSQTPHIFGDREE